LTDNEKTAVEPAAVPIQETWRALEKLVDNGLARSIGVSNFQAQSLYDVWTYARHPVSALQIEHHPYLVQPNLISLAQEHGVAVTAYSSFGPQSFLELPAFSGKTKDAQPPLSSDLIKGIADKHSVSPAQVLLRWATQRSIAVIPKSSSVERMRQNLQVLEDNFSLSEEEVNIISGLDRGLRFNDPGSYLKDCMSKPLRIFA
jgi:D-xylose reductase